MSLKVDHERTVTNFIYTDDMGTKGITELMVCRSNAGFYVGRYCDDGPYSRESGYYNTRPQAEYALNHPEG